MLAALDSLAGRLESLPLATRQELVALVQRFGKELLAYNQGYLLKGERPDGEPIQASGYSPAYAAYRKKYGRQTAFVDLQLTGDFQEKFVLPYLGSLEFEIDNLDPKAAKLLKSYGPLYGVREEDLQDYVSTFLEPAIREFVTRYMHTT
jgi:hypothetical protein